MKKPNLNEILKSLTLDEKIAQLYQTVPYILLDENPSTITGPMENIGLNDISEETLFNSGTALGGSGYATIINTQKKVQSLTKHKLPLIFMADVIHGFKTIFPIPLAVACSWDMDIAKESAEIAALESAVSGINVTFSPMVDLVRDPRWGRVMESTGEDPYLNCLFAKAFVEGYQGDDVSKFGKIAACVKHFAGYGASEAGRDYNSVDVSERALREYYLPSYKAAIDAGAKMIMTSFNIIDSIPATANQWLFRTILRDEWNYEGVSISDWGAINELIPHGIAKDGKEAAEKAIKAGIDIEMMTTEYLHYLKELIDEGKIKESLIDEAVLRILQLKQDLNLFEKPFKDTSKENEEKYILCKEHRDASRKIATESIVLLKNENILPLPKNKKIAIIGPYANANHILGGWSCEGRDEDAINLETGIINKIGKENVFVNEGCDIYGEKQDFDSALECAKKADIIVLAIGEHPHMSGESSSKAFITIPGFQEELANKILELNKPTVVVLFNGRPMEITDLSQKAPAILEAWFPGTEGGNAISDILFGEVCPSAKLTMSFPYTVGQIPVYYNHYNTGRPSPRAEGEDFYSRYIDIPNEPLYPFGFGLTYTTFAYSDLKLSSETLSESSTINVSVNVKNTGKTSCREIVQLYIRDISGSVVRPVKELKGFKKILLNPGQTELVEFEINEEMLRFCHSDKSFASENGDFKVFVGPNSRDLLTADFQLKK